MFLVVCWLCQNETEQNPNPETTLIEGETPSFYEKNKNLWPKIWPVKINFLPLARYFSYKNL